MFIATPLYIIYALVHKGFAMADLFTFVFTIWFNRISRTPMAINAGLVQISLTLYGNSPLWISTSVPSLPTHD